MSEINNIKKTFGLALRNLRELNGLTQEQLAEQLNLQSYQTINRIENGKSFITSELLEKMCKFFQVEPYVFFLNNNQTYTPQSIDHIVQINSKLNRICTILEKMKN